MRNSSLVKRSRAENVTGLKCSTEDMDVCIYTCVVEERRYQRRSETARFRGALSSENAGMSNHKTCENHVGRKSKVS